MFVHFTRPFDINTKHNNQTHNQIASDGAGSFAGVLLQFPALRTSISATHGFVYKHNEFKMV
jgi:hypothetical protein